MHFSRFVLSAVLTAAGALAGKAHVEVAECIYDIETSPYFSNYVVRFYDDTLGDKSGEPVILTTKRTTRGERPRAGYDFLRNEESRTFISKHKGGWNMNFKYQDKTHASLNLEHTVPRTKAKFGSRKRLFESNTLYAPASHRDGTEYKFEIIEGEKEVESICLAGMLELGMSPERVQEKYGKVTEESRAGRWYGRYEVHIERYSMSSASSSEYSDDD